MKHLWNCQNQRTIEEVARLLRQQIGGTLVVASDDTSGFTCAHGDYQEYNNYSRFCEILDMDVT
jgi:hypothetical protein